MAAKNSGDDNLSTRIAELQKRIELLEAGSLGTRERVVRDNRPILIDTTKQTIERNKQWMRDLCALRATAPAPVAKAKRRGRRRIEGLVEGVAGGLIVDGAVAERWRRRRRRG